MKKLLLLILLISYALTGTAQVTELDHTKYWYYRNRLLKNFMVKGEEPNLNCTRPTDPNYASGHSIPASSILNSGNYITYGDATIKLSAYIAVLATEYRLLKNNNLPTDTTLQELYFAMKAYERLDYKANKIFYPWTDPCLIDGFFVRDDVLPGLVDNSHLNKYEMHGNFDPGGSDYAGTKYCGFNFIAPDNGFDGNIGTTTVPYKNECNVFGTTDQISNLLMAFALVKRCVEPSTHYNGYYFNIRAKDLTNAIVSYMASNNWVGKIAGTNETYRFGGEMFGDGYALAKANNRISGNYNGTTQEQYLFWQSKFFPYGILFFTENYFSQSYIIGYSMALAAAGNSWEINVPQVTRDICVKVLGRTICRRVYCYDLSVLDHYPNVISSIPACSPVPLSPITINTTANSLSAYGAMYNAELFILVNQFLYGGDNLFITHDKYVELINSAPCQGPYWLPFDDPTATGEEGWRCSYRWTSGKWGKNGQDGFKGRFNGLDYMLLYNMYQLMYPNQVNYSYSNKMDVQLNITMPYHITATGYTVGNVSNPLEVKAFNSILADNTVKNNAKVTLHAGSVVELTDGFETETGAEFEAYAAEILPENTCNSRTGSYARMAANTTEVDTAAIVAKYNELIKNDLQEKIKSINTDSLKNEAAKYEYEPRESYIKEVKEKSLESTSLTVKIYPNPANSGVYVQFAKNPTNDTQIAITDISGRVIYTLKTTQHETVYLLNLKGIAPGIYFIEIASEEYKQTHKLLKVE